LSPYCITCYENEDFSLRFISFHSTVITNAMCFLGLLGIFLMIIVNELTFRNIDNEFRCFVWLMQLIITFTTIILIGLIIYYHCVNLTLYSVQKSVTHWRFALTVRKLCGILFEIVICSIHPFPRSFPFNDDIQQHNTTLTRSFYSNINTSLSFIPFNVALGLPSKY
jgi:hypothetical protein